MSTNSIILPHGVRLFTSSLSLRKAALLAKKAFSIIPTPSSLRRFRSGSTFSRAVRHIFEHNHLPKILGSNLAFAVVASSLIQGQLHNTTKQFTQASEPIIKAEVLSFVTERGIQAPLESTKINQRFTVFHPGIDYEGETGDPVYAIMSGRVDSTQQSRFAYGNAIIVDHGNGLTSLYAHLSKINVKKGQDVSNDTVIGLVGSTGHSTGDHLHIEVRDNGKPLNPLTVLPK